MSVYALGDLHLSFGTDKPMDIFGDTWGDYTNKIKENWQSIVTPRDLVIIPGDVSWSTYLEDAYEDFKFINELNGRKIILKGNHDFWWTTLSKMNKFLEENNFDTIQILNNTAVEFENAAICGTRGWWYKEEQSEDDEKILDREKKRLVLSLEEAVKLKKERLIVGLHYPPICPGLPKQDFMDIMREYKVDVCVYGHLHSHSHKNAVNTTVDGIRLQLVSGDYLNFKPILV